MTASSMRALARVARRDITRHRGRSLLVALLIVLPVAAMVAGIIVLQTTEPSAERQTTHFMGRADLLAIGQEDAIRAYLPEGSTMEAAETSDARLVLPGARVSVAAHFRDLSGLAAGMLTIVAGRAPASTTEVAISADVAKLTGASIGGQIILEELPSLTVVGLVEDEMSLRNRFVLLDPSLYPPDPESYGSWLVGLPPGTDAQALADGTIDPVTGEQLLSVYTREGWQLQAYGSAGSTSATILVLGTLALVESALIASAAFAVSIRRRQRELGLLAATGATPRQLAATVLAEAGILGAAAALSGIVAGVVIAYASTPWLDDLIGHRNPPPVIDPAALIGPFVIGVAAALIAAIVPARSAATVPVLVSLSGRRPPQRPAHRTLALGLVAIAVAAGLTLLGANLRLDGSEAPSILLMIAGAVLGTLGFGACGPWLLERLEGLARRLPLAPRIAFRDTARSRSRSSPIVTAVLASFAGAIALGTWTASRDADNAMGWRPILYPDQLLISGPGAAQAGQEVALADGVLAVASVPRLVPEREDVFLSFTFPGARDADGKVINLLDGCGNCSPGAFDPYQVSEVAVATPDVLAMAHAEAAAAELAAGRAVLLSDGIRPRTIEDLEIEYQPDASSADPPQVLRYPATLLVVGVGGGILPNLLLPDKAIHDLGLREAPGEFVVLRYDHKVTDADVGAASAIASKFIDTYADALAAPVRQGQGFRLALIAAALLFAISVTGIAVALGEAESRPEQRSLLALGADPRLRRRIAAARAGVMALLAGLLAVPAGILPVWGLLASREALFVVPVEEVVAAVALLPLLAVLGTFLLSRPIPDWAAFRGVAAGQ